MSWLLEIERAGRLSPRSARLRLFGAVAVALALAGGCSQAPDEPAAQQQTIATPTHDDHVETADPAPPVQANEESKTMPGVLLRDLTWLEAERLLGPDTVVVIPLGAEAKEHGPHLRLDNDLTLATYFRDRVRAQAEVVVLPTLNYHYYPAFAEYPGSTSLRLETARDLTIDVVRSIARHGPRRFYVLNTGVSTVRALAPAAELLAAEGILLTYTDLLKLAGPVEAEIAQQPRGTHADEIETSMLLYIAPDRVDMSQAVAETSPRGDKGWLTRDPAGPGTVSRTGVWGDPTLATRDKGQRVVEALVAGMLADIEALRQADLPAGGRE